MDYSSYTGVDRSPLDGALETDPSYKWSNYPMAQYYDKDFIIALPD